MFTDQIAERLACLPDALDAGVFTELTTARALAEAGRVDAARSRGAEPRPLAGVTVAWKDVFEVARCVTRAGTRFLDSAPAARDHRLVARLADRGAICVGKTSLSELAVSALGENDACPAPVNPWDGRRVCGGSSSGAAAAVAWGLTDVGIGTDCGGSVRLPAAWCGVVGFKPSRELIDPRGIVPFSATLDTVGVLAPTVRLAAHTVAALTSRPTHSAPVRDLVDLCHVPLPLELPLDPEVAEVYQAALACVAWAGHPVPEAGCDPLGWAWDFRGEHGSTASDEGLALWRATVLAAGDLASARLQRWFAAPPSGHRGDRRRARDRMVARFLDAVRPGTVLVTPTSPIKAPPLSSLRDEQAYERCYRFSNALLWPFNELDAPAISIPCGRTSSGLPVGLQLVAPRGRDGDVLAAAAEVEAVLAGQFGSSSTQVRRA